MNRNINPILYISFIALGLYYLIVKSDFTEATITLGIALAFDPFNQQTQWQLRPLWQRAVVLIHLAAMAAIFGYQIGFNDK